MHIRDAIAAAVEGRDLAYDDMLEVVRRIMTGETTPAQIAGFLVALRMKGETVDEITAAAAVMRELSLKVDCDCAPLIDTCGTGGDASGTFNISTAAAFVVAAAGGHVAKHGNRSVSSSSGSADLLEAAGVKIALPPPLIARAVRETGFGFMFAQAHHSATRHAAGPRRELGIRTLFNVLGPLTNPAAAPLQLVGLFSADWVRKIAAVLRRLGTRRALVVHAQDGLDEISIGAPTQIAELNAGEISHYLFNPAALGIAPAPLAALRVANAAESLALIERVYANEPGPARDVVALNAGAALYLCDFAASIEEGYRAALALIARGAARAAFDRHIAFTQAIEVPCT
ncbi:MAG TPA: anthranilate phosphoribosyltransferase [Gammaproteobacteria bacterium]|nr:anthranilate phosphoribosyltransferase [Gammaproteobacteria bacterium]